MIHHSIHPESNSGDHWGVGSNEYSGLVLVQIQENGEQVRLGLTLEHAEAMAAAIMDHAAKVRRVRASKAPA